jgi:Flp pilus assembly protein TadG
MKREKGKPGPMRNTNTVRGRLFSLRQEEAGSETIEFTVGAMLIFMAIFGIMDCSRAVYINHFLAQAARDGARYAMLRGATWTNSCTSTSGANCTASGANVKNFVDSLASVGVSASRMTVNATWPGTTPGGSSCGSGSSNANAQGCVVNVQVSYPFNFVLPFLPNGMTMSSSSAATILQ